MADAGADGVWLWRCARACFAVVFILGGAGTAVAQEDAYHDSLA